ncbi:hypothetical protein HYC85_027091 [Camellia sinensis]|uniref:Uncharacterized protein n=1 Tax=Camellia sinensis TaxID=4442 RepID=A0A7J7G5F1_CAMSI|nr:hypothetical protein HYC85_027091 [Camellia sinensis]
MTGTGMALNPCVRGCDSGYRNGRTENPPRKGGIKSPREKGGNVTDVGPIQKLSHVRSVCIWGQINLERPCCPRSCGTHLKEGPTMVSQFCNLVPFLNRAVSLSLCPCTDQLRHPRT